MIESASPRLTWAAEVMDVAPDDRVLEIGCGQGALVTLVCQRLESGMMIAIDRSERMIEAALRRNRKYVVDGKARFLVEELSDAQFGSASFSKIVAFNVGTFWRTDAPELKRLRQWLAPGGTLYLFYQPPTDSFERESIERLTRRLGEEGFAVAETLVRETEPTRAICVRAEPVR